MEQNIFETNYYLWQSQSFQHKINIGVIIIDNKFVVLCCLWCILKFKCAAGNFRGGIFSFFSRSFALFVALIWVALIFLSYLRWHIYNAGCSVNGPVLVHKHCTLATQVLPTVGWCSYHCVWSYVHSHLCLCVCVYLCVFVCVFLCPCVYVWFM